MKHWLFDFDSYKSGDLFLARRSRRLRRAGERYANIQRERYRVIYHSKII